MPSKTCRTYDELLPAHDADAKQAACCSVKMYAGCCSHRHRTSVDASAEAAARAVIIPDLDSHADGIAAAFTDVEATVAAHQPCNAQLQGLLAGVVTGLLLQGQAEQRVPAPRASNEDLPPILCIQVEHRPACIAQPALPVDPHRQLS